MDFPANIKTLTDKERQEKALQVLRRYPLGLTAKEWTKKIGCGYDYFSKLTKALKGKIWVKRLGGRNLCHYYHMSYVRRVNRMKNAEPIPGI